VNTFVCPENSLTLAVSTTTEKPNALPVRFLQALQWQIFVQSGPPSSWNLTAPHEHPPSYRVMNPSGADWHGPQSG
jgi:hypothetical protein